MRSLLSNANSEVKLPYNALPFLVTHGVSSALSRRFADFWTTFREADSPVGRCSGLLARWRFITRNPSNVAFHWASDHLPGRAENVAALRSSRNTGCETVKDNNAGRAHSIWVV